MATHQTKLSEEIQEQILGFTAGEGDEKRMYQILNENKYFELKEIKKC
jgi:hypothetical protein